MILKVNPATFLRGKIKLPASKSYSIRAFLIASCGGRSSIIAPSDSDDALIAMKAARALGAKIARRTKNNWVVIAFQKKFQLFHINVQESGTVLRFILPLISFYTDKAIINGRGTLRGRPNSFLLQTLRKSGICIYGHGKKESVPITYQGGNLKGGKIALDGSLSSQFVSSFLIACPLLREDSHLVLTGKNLVSADYIIMTLQVLKEAGIAIRRKGVRDFFISGRQAFKGLKHFVVPSDYGLAAFLLVGCSLISSEVTFKGYLVDKLIQADRHILKFLRQMGVVFKKTAAAITLKGPFLLRGGSFSLRDCPDLVPIMAVLALFAKGKTRLYGIAHARAKESDRISDLRKELMKVGAVIKEKKDELVIFPQPRYKMNQILDPHRDHRLAMAFAVLGLKIGANVKDIECTHKSYPQFVKDFKKMGARASFV